MSEKLQYSKDLISVEDDNDISKIFYNGQYIASAKMDFDNMKSSIVLFDINKKFNLIGFFNNTITQIILESFRYPINELIFENFPITYNDFNVIFKKFKKEYEKSINIIDIELDSMQCIKRVVIQIQLPKNTHYIQQAYLRNFSSNTKVWKSDNQKDKARIFVFDKYKNAIIIKGNTAIELKYGQKIRGIAIGKNFYSLAMEQLMRKIYETYTPPIFNKLIKNPNIINLTEEEKKITVDYILLTWSRTRECRKQLKEVYEKTVKIFAEDYKGKRLPYIDVRIDPNFLRKWHEDHMMTFLSPNSDEYRKLSQHLLQLHWKIIKTKFPHTFLTSDNPVIFFNSYYEEKKKKGNDYMTSQIKNFKKQMDFDNWEGYIEIKGEFGKAIANKSVEIYLPISPTICLCLYDKERTKTLLSPHKINREIILQADQYIFSHHNRLNFIKKILLENPGCIERDGNRQEVRASFKKIINSK